MSIQQAIIEAKKASKRGEIPVGAVITQGDKIIASAGNMVEKTNDPTAHAEILAIRKACKVLNTKFLTNCDIYVTLEPCAMCAKAISLARIRRLYFGAYDIKGGAVINGELIFNQLSCNHKPEIYDGINEAECKKLLQDFFVSIRK